MAAKKDLIDLLDVLNATLLVETQKIHLFHYYVKGDNFFTLHKILDDYYEAVFEHVDEVAEELLKLGAKPTSTYAGALKLSLIKEGVDKTFIEEEPMKKELIADLETVQKLIQKVHGLADEEEVYTVQALMDDIEAFYAKSIWMMKQDLK